MGTLIERVRHQFYTKLYRKSISEKPISFIFYHSKKSELNTAEQ